MAKPFGEKNDETKTIHVSWDPVPEAENGGQTVISYELSMEIFDQKAMVSKEIFAVDGHKWKLEGYENCKFYRFSIRAKNICGFSSFSPVKVVDTKITPFKMEIISTEQSACSAKMSWKMPYNCGSPIERYHVQVKTRDGEFRGLETCGEQPTDVSCLVNM